MINKRTGSVGRWVGGPVALGRTGGRLRRCGPARYPAGLAPLELVLVLPLLLFVTALIINAGTSAAWKVRALGTTREAAWRARWPRHVHKPHPDSWPQSASMSAGGIGRLEVLEVPSIDQPVVRGPVIGEANVDRNLLDPSRGAFSGKTSIERTRPLLPTLSPMKYALDHALLSNTFPYPRTRLSNNVQRRIKVIYDMEENDLRGWGAYVSAVDQVVGVVTQSNLRPLTYHLPPWTRYLAHTNRYYDPDYDRLLYFPVSETLGPFRPSSPNYHPALPGFCSLDAEAVYNNQVATLIENILDDPNVSNDPSLPRRLASGYISLYRSAIAVVQRDLDELIENEAPPAVIAGVEAELAARKAELEPKIEELRLFRAQF